jgi:hypothetical protein
VTLLISSVTNRPRALSPVPVVGFVDMAAAPPPPLPPEPGRSHEEQENGVAASSTGGITTNSLSPNQLEAWLLDLVLVSPQGVPYHTPNVYLIVTASHFLTSCWATQGLVGHLP